MAKAPVPVTANANIKVPIYLKLQLRRIEQQFFLSPQALKNLGIHPRQTKCPGNSNMLNAFNNST